MAFVPGCSSKTAKSSPGSAGAIPVQVAQVSRMNVPVTVDTVGTVEAFSSVIVLSRVDGQILRRHFQEGQAISAGDLLYSIDPAPLQQKLKNAEGQLARDEAKARFSKAEAERFSYLLKRGVVSHSDDDGMQSEAAALEQIVLSDRAAVEEARINLSYCEVRSPISGRTGSYLADAGAVVEALKTSLVVINQIDPAKVSFAVPEKHLPTLHGLMTSGARAVSVTVPDTELRRHGGRISFLDNSVDRATGMIRLKAEFPNQDSMLWPGQFVNVALAVAAFSNAVVAPSEAVQANQKGRYVFVVKPDGTAELRAVTTGQPLGSLAVVSHGLKPGETVVTDGQNKLRSGSKVSVLAGSAPGQGPVAARR